LGLVVAGGVEGELADELAGVVEDSDVSSGDEYGDGFAGVASSDADVVETSGVADGEFAVTSATLLWRSWVAVNRESEEQQRWLNRPRRRPDS